MKGWHFIVAAAAILAALVYLAYAPYLLDSTEETSSELIEPSFQDHVLTFASDPWPPYAGTAGAEQEGYILDVLREIYEPLDYRVRFVNKPWSRCIAEVRSGKLTGLAGCDVHEAPDLVYPRRTIGSTQPTFFVRKDSSWRYEGVESLSSIRLGAIQDYTYERSVDVYIRQHQGTDRVLLAKGNDALQQLIGHLRAGRIDTFVETAPVVRAVLHASDGEVNGIISAGEAPGLDLFVPFSPRLPEARRYAQLFDKGIDQLRSNGRLAEILASYGLEDWRLDDMAGPEGGTE